MCKVRWLAHEHPGVVRGPWTEQERLDLKRAVEEARRQPRAQDNGTHPLNEDPSGGGMEVDNEDEVEDNEGTLDVDWEVVAGFLGVSPVQTLTRLALIFSLQSGRIAADCMKAYRSTSGRAVPTVWTPELDAQLLESVNRFGANNMTTGTPSLPLPHALTHAFSHSGHVDAYCSLSTTMFKSLFCPHLYQEHRKMVL